MSNPLGRPSRIPNVELICKQCVKPFTMKGHVARGYEKKHGKAKPYCSMKCFYNAANRHEIDLSEDAPTYICAGCGDTTRRRRDVLHGQPGQWDMRQKFCSLSCSHESRFAAKQAERAAGVFPRGHISSSGYHVTKGAHGRTIQMHRAIMEQHLGRALRGSENVHHINGDRADNRLENLELWVKTQPCGQRATDRVAAAISFLQDYPELTEAAGFRLVKCIGG
jgi:hypothetical protein